MKTLPLEFEQAADGLKKQRFKQVRREGNITIYERRHLDGRLFGYEVFTVKCKVFPGQTEPPGSLFPWNEPKSGSKP